ncbi:MAG: hypothetical protein ABSC06_18950 [Rhodopila sp.]
MPPLMMAAEGLPPLFFAGYLKAHQRAYYDGLAGAQLRGRWTDWLGFFLDGIAAAAATEQATAQNLRQGWQIRTADEGAGQRQLPGIISTRRPGCGYSRSGPSGFRAMPPIPALW